MDKTSEVEVFGFKAGTVGEVGGFLLWYVWTLLWYVWTLLWYVWTLSNFDLMPYCNVNQGILFKG